MREHVQQRQLIQPVISIAVMALHRQNAEADGHVALVLDAHASGTDARKRVYSAPDLHDSKARLNMSMTRNSHYALSPTPATPAQARAKARVRPAAKKAHSKVAKSKHAKKK